MNKIVTNKIILKEGHVWNRTNWYGKEKYVAIFTIQKNNKETIDKINNAINDAFEEAKQNKRLDKNITLDHLKLPFFQRFDEINGEQDYELITTSNTAPQIVDRNIQPIIDCDGCIDGDIVRASLSFYYYNVNGNKGIACGLGNIQVWRD